jgi:hypothetical protein
VKDADAQDLFGRAPATCLRLLPVSLLQKIARSDDRHGWCPYS